MTSLPNRPNRTLAIGLPLLVMLACSILVFSPVFAWRPDALSTGITLDLTLTAPILYFLVIRGTRVPKMTVIRVFIVGLLLAGLLLHDKPHFLLGLLKTWVAPVAEGLVIFLLARKFYRARQTAANLDEDMDFLVRCRTILSEVTGNEKAGHVIASEMAVLYYAFIPLRKRRREIVAGIGGQAPHIFTSYKTNGILLVLGVFLCCFFVETAGVHFLVGMWSKKGAWILTALGAYTALQLYAHMRAIPSRPVLVGDRSLHLRNGLASDISIPIEYIEAIFFEGKTWKSSRGAERTAKSLTVNLALIKGLENHNIRLQLKQPLLVNRAFGIRQEAITILFFVDKPKEFLEAVNAKLIQNPG